MDIIKNIEKNLEEGARDFEESIENITHEHRKSKIKDPFNKTVIILIGVLAAFLILNQFLISSINITGGSVKKVDVSEISQIKTTSQTVAMLFPVENIKSDEDAIAMMISQGTPEYGESMGITFDDPVSSMTLLASNYNNVKNDVKQNYPEIWERYLNLATKPVGISCEFCCGVGPVGINKKGDITCGCQHNPAFQALTMLLMKDTKYDDVEVLREVMRWKALWFPKDMVNIALKASGGEIETELPGMVGGC